MEVPKVLEKVMEKIKEILNNPSLSEEGVTIGLLIDVRLNEGQYNELIGMLKSMGYNFYKKEIGAQGDMIEIYYNKGTGEYISINYVKDRKYDIGVVTYYWDGRSE